MPNTLAHFGVQGAASRALFGKLDPRWFLLGCALPDVPWIGRRIAAAVHAGIDPYALRLYATTQASLACTLFLCAAVASFAPKPRRIFLLLGFNALAHLLLDACQTKWGNGVHLLAPFSWRLDNWGLFWPESWATHTLTLVGIGFVVWAWRRGLWGPFVVDRRRWPFAMAFLAVYLALPFAIQSGAFDADAHSIRTFRDKSVGSPVAIDRSTLVVEDGAARIEAWTRESYRASGDLPDRDATVSIQGTLTEPDAISVARHHEHNGSQRDLPTYAGLAVLAASIVVGLARARAVPKVLA
ncbi:MAG: hypothetical protein ACYTGZ_06160 [Planctomycetota bacterium]